jgi:hypothetical protein
MSTLFRLLERNDTRAATTLLDRMKDLELQLIEDRLPNIKPGTLKYVSWDENRWYGAESNVLGKLSRTSPRFSALASRFE